MVQFPIGGTLNKKAAIDSEAFCMSVVIGDDIVPRLSVYSVQLLIEQIWQELRKCQISKYRVPFSKKYQESEHGSGRNLDPERGRHHAESRLLPETQLPDRLTEPENSSDEIHSTEPIQKEPIKKTEEEVRIEISPAESISQERQAVDEGEPSTSKKNHDSQSDKMDDSPSDSEEQYQVESVPSEMKVRFTVSTPEHDQENTVAEEGVRGAVDQGAAEEIELFIPGKILHISPRTITDSKETPRVRWASRIDFRNIIISYYMLKDHSSKTLGKILQKEALDKNSCL
ncbi:uncharacterized protein LOC136031184 [Artemia franciscana]|uniref:Uncharacterized protein n=1 Tax=Artemia franciscana TaxID=6661 RepID=A0AA88KVM5_ARTSF|nr:hypothetical protein QYM36_017345 [Artemia franciscana]